MKFIYWNTKNFREIRAIIEICKEYSPDIIFLSETSSIFIDENTDQLAEIGYQNFKNPGCDRIVILSKVSINIDLGIQSHYYTNVKVLGIDVIAVHFPATMHHHMSALRNHLLNFRNLINVEIGKSSETAILIIGDLNVNPFEAPMINFDGFMATNSPNARESVTNLGDCRETYYNPTWMLFADNRFPGTMKFPRPSAVSFDILEFHFLDQVLLSQNLKNMLDGEIIETIKETSSFAFYNSRNNRVDYSDHLPIVYEFKIK